MLLRTTTVSILSISFAVAAPTAAQPLPAQDATRFEAGDRCELSAPLSIITDAEGRRLTLQPASVVEVVEIRDTWVSVRSGQAAGWVRDTPLGDTCRAALAEEATPEVARELPPFLAAPKAAAQPAAEPVAELPAAEQKQQPYAPAASAPVKATKTVWNDSASAPVSIQAAEQVAPSAAAGCDAEDLAGCRTQCEGGDAKACFTLGERFEELTAAALLLSEETAQRSADAFSRGCSQGHAPSCMRSAELALTEDNAAAASELLAEACRAGDGGGCAQLALMLRDGKGVPQDLTQAAAFYQRGCELGSAKGCSGWGSLLMRGQGVPQSLAQALTLFSKACSTGGEDSAEGCAHLGYLYESGQGTEKNLIRAEAAYRAGCQRGDTYACGRLQAINVAASASERVEVVNAQPAAARFAPRIVPAGR